MEGAAELETQPERFSREHSVPEPVLEVDLASRVDSSEAEVENSDDATAPKFSDHQAGVSSCPTPTRSLIETDLSLGIVGKLERSHDACDGQQDSRKNPDEDASVSESCTQTGSNGIEVRDTLLSLQIRVRDLEIQLKDRIDWAQQKVMQAAQTVSKERQELNAVRAERDEALRFKKEQKAVEESALRKKAELETALRKASAEVRRLEVENAEVRAEMEAAKLSAAESVAIYQEVAKREKKGAKRAQGWEKQKAKLQEELSEEKRKLAQLQQALAQANERHLQAEVRWRQEEKAKEEAIARADKEKRTKEQAEAAFKRREEVTRRKVEQDKQRLRDDIERLTQELSTLRATGSHNFVSASWNSPVATVGMMGGRIGHKEIERLVREVADLEQDLLQRDVRRDRECVMCMCEEMSVVFMPCAHQVVCIKCNELHEKQGMRDCPSCRTPIQQRIRVYGASS